MPPRNDSSLRVLVILGLAAGLAGGGCRRTYLIGAGIGDAGTGEPPISPSDAGPPDGQAPDVAPTAADILSIAAGGFNSCAVMKDGALYCWGSNEWNQLQTTSTGAPDYLNSPLPVRIALPAAVKKVAVGGGFICAALEDDSLRCWGRNDRGQSGTAGCAGICAVAQLSAAADVAAGERHACALLSDGSLRCWGGNDFGQLGDGTTTDSAVPRPVLDSGGQFVKAVQLSVGSAHSCALTQGGTVSCWGANHYAQIDSVGTDCNLLDSGAATPCKMLAVTVDGGTDVAEVRAGATRTCVRRNDKTAACWGGAGNSRSPPVASQASNVEEIAFARTDALTAHVCVRRTGGGVSCGWEWDTSTMPIDLPALASGATQIALGYDHLCALVPGDGLRCGGGQNYFGQRGDGATVGRFTPRSVPGLAGVEQLAVGGEGVARPQNSPVLAADGSMNHACARMGDGTVQCWGANDHGQAGQLPSFRSNVQRSSVRDPRVVPGLANVVDIAAGAWHSCAVIAGGQVMCWGDNSVGELGPRDGAACTNVSNTISPLKTDCHVPELVTGISGVRKLALGGHRTCVLKDDGTVVCWGYNPTINLSDPLASTEPPAVVAGLDQVTDIAAGRYHACARRQDGTVLCFGFAYPAERAPNPRITPLGRLLNQGDPSWSPPGPVDNLPAVTALSVGGHRACGLVAGGIPFCWGAWRTEWPSVQYFPTFGTGDPLGVPAPPAELTLATPVSGDLGAVAEIAVGNSQICARMVAGDLRCWGKVPGDGASTDKPAPVVVKLANVKQLAAGFSEICALLADGTVTCWGDDLPPAYAAFGPTDPDIASRTTTTLVKW